MLRKSPPQPARKNAAGGYRRYLTGRNGGRTAAVARFSPGRYRPALLLQDVRPGRVAERRVRLAAERGRGDLVARALAEPGGPVGPPAALVLRGAFEPGLGRLRGG